MGAAYNLLNLVALIVWLPLILLLIARLLRREWRRFPFIFAFVVVDFLTGVADAPGVWAVYRNVPNALQIRASTWAKAELLTQILIFVVVLSLVHRATAQLRSRNLVRTACLLGAVLFVGVTFRLHYNPATNTLAWFTPWTRDLDVCTTILDLALWMLLLVRRQKDYQLFVLSGALGIQFTGSAIGNSLRSMATRQTAWLYVVGGVIVIASNLIRIYMWARTFKSTPQKRPAARIASASV